MKRMFTLACFDGRKGKGAMSELALVVVYCAALMAAAAYGYFHPNGIWRRSALGVGAVAAIGLAAWAGGSPWMAQETGFGALVLWLALIALAGCLAASACIAASARYSLRSLRVHTR